MRNRIVRLFVKTAHSRPDIVSGRAKFESLNVTDRDGLLHLSVNILLPKEQVLDKHGLLPVLQKRVDVFRELISKDIGEPLVLEFEILPIDMIRVRSQPPERRTAEQPADNKE